MSFHKTLEQLRSLQEVFNEKFDIESKLLELPQEVDTREQMVLQLQKEFLMYNEKYGQLKKEMGLKQDDLRHAQEHREKLEKEISLVSSQRDYELMDRAVKENEEHENSIVQELNSLKRKFDELQEKFQASENFLKEQEVELEETKIEVDKQVAALTFALQECKNKEILISSDLNDNLAFKFERIIRSKGGDGIVPIRNSVCYGCHIVLPVQFVNEVRAEDKIFTCPYCSKIVYYDKDDDATVLDNVDIPSLQDIASEDDIELDDFETEDYEDLMDKSDMGSDAYIPVANLEEGSEDDDDITDDEEEEEYESETYDEDDLED